MFFSRAQCCEKPIVSKGLIGLDIDHQDISFSIGNKNVIKIMQFNMLANGLMDSFLKKRNIGIFFNTSGELEKKKSYFDKLNSNIKSLFDNRNVNKSMEEFKQIIGHVDCTEEVEYNDQELDMYERYFCIIKGHDERLIKRINNIINKVWTIVQKEILQENIQKINCNYDLDQVIKIVYRIKIIVELFQKDYKNYKSDIDAYRDTEKNIITNITNYLAERFKMFKSMIQQYDPDIMCLQEDDFDNYFNAEDYFVSTYDFLRCKKNPSQAQKIIKTNKTLWLNGLTQEYRDRAPPDGVTILFKKSKFRDANPSYNNNVARFKKSPYLIKHLINIDTGDNFCIVCAHLESGREDYSKEMQRIETIGTILKDPEFNRIMEIKTMNLIICMDANTPFLNERTFKKYYSKENIPEDGLLETSGTFIKSDIMINGDPIAKNSALFKLMDKLKMTQDNHGVEEPTKMYSVNKLRGPESHQLSKIFEYENHLIDHIFFKGHEGSKYVMIKTKLPIMNPGNYYNDLLPNYEYDKSTVWDNFYNFDSNTFISTSDHLSLFIVLKNSEN